VRLKIRLYVCRAGASVRAAGREAFVRHGRRGRPHSAARRRALRPAASPQWLGSRVKRPGSPPVRGPERGHGPPKHEHPLQQRPVVVDEAVGGVDRRRRAVEEELHLAVSRPLNCPLHLHKLKIWQNASYTIFGP